MRLLRKPFFYVATVGFWPQAAGWWFGLDFTPERLLTTRRPLALPNIDYE